MSLRDKLLSKFRVGRRRGLTMEEYMDKLEHKGMDPETGHVVPDPTPMAPPIGYKRQPSMVEIVREMVRSERLAAEVGAAGYETFEEADDFDVGDEPDDLKSGFENDFDPPIRELAAAGAEEVKKRNTAAKEKAKEKPATPPPPSPDKPTEKPEN